MVSWSAVYKLTTKLEIPLQRMWKFTAPGASFINAAYAQKGLEMCVHDFLSMNWGKKTCEEMYVHYTLTLEYEHFGVSGKLEADGKVVN